MLGDQPGSLAFLVISSPPCILHEDDDLLVVNKPAGLNTHSPAPFASEGLYDWLRHRDLRWQRLAIIQRLDKETSGVLVFTKTPAANASLTEQFTQRSVQKTYLLLSDRPLPRTEIQCRSQLIRLGDKYISRPLGAGPEARTTFRSLPDSLPPYFVIEATPETGRTHQIRVHAADLGIPILGDVTYGGSPFRRVCLHAAALTFHHPTHGQQVTFTAPHRFQEDPRSALREALWPADETNCYRLIHGLSDDESRWYLDRLGNVLLASSNHPAPPSESVAARLAQFQDRYRARAVYWKQLQKNPGQAAPEQSSPRLIHGDLAGEECTVRENGLSFALSFREGYSMGLFLDQRDNRRRLLTHYVARDFSLFPNGPGSAQVLNTFAYTCAFSVAAAKSGAQTTSLDLSKAYLEWGKRNFVLNGLDPQRHDFIFGDAINWMERLRRKGRSFDLVILDPPTFSRSREFGTFQAEKDYPRLLQAALPLIKTGGTLLASTNAGGFEPATFEEMVLRTIGNTRNVRQHLYAPQPLDFPTSRNEPAHLKTVWVSVD